MWQALYSMNCLRQKNSTGGGVGQNNENPALRSLFMHAWDVADDGVENVFEWCSDAGLNAVTLAATYHSGWFLHPDSRSHRAFMTEGSVSYFHLSEDLWNDAKLRPTVAKLCAKKDWFAEAGKHANKLGLKLISWTVGCHNSKLGFAHPDLTQQNVYGDRLPHALCPTQPVVRQYLITLCRDLAQNHSLWAIQLEAFGWMGFMHGHHHERDLVGLNALEQDLMGICVCSACQAAMSDAGVDVEKVIQSIRSTLDVAFREAPTRPPDHPSSMRDLETRFPEVRKFNEWRRQFLVGLIKSIRAEALAGTSCRLLLQTPFEAELLNDVDGFSCFSFGKSAAETEAICREATAPLPKSWNRITQCCVQLGMGIPRTQIELQEIINAVSRGGCNGIAFYNRSESPPKMLAWLKAIGAECWKSQAATSTHRIPVVTQ